jgi:hypothetical protein
MRGVLLFGVFITGLTAFLWLCAPGYTSLGEPLGWWDGWVEPAGLAGMVVGVLLMVRIYRRPLEDEPPAWRYRDR